MKAPDPVKLQTHRARLYFLMVGALGAFGLSVELGVPERSLAVRALLTTGLVLMISYLAVSVLFGWLRNGPWPTRVAAAMSIWGLVLTAGCFVAKNNLAVPAFLFIALPAGGAAIRSHELMLATSSANS